MPIPSPLEYLAAFAIAFASGFLFSLGLTRYIEHVKRKVHPMQSSPAAA